MTFRGHLWATGRLAAPIAVSMLAQMAMGLTDTVMLGTISDRALAAGGLGANLFFTTNYALQGVLSGVAVLAAGAVGRREPAAAGRAYWAGLWLAALLAVPFVALMSAPGPLFRVLGEPPGLATDAGTYLSVLRWGAPGGLLGIGVVRTLLPAIGLEALLVWVIPAAVVVNLGLNIWFIRGGFGLPALGLRGSALATAVTLWLTALVLLGLLHAHRQWRHVVRPAWPRAADLRSLLAIGVPAGGMVLVEASLFLATGLLMGRLGPQVLAAHTIALSVCTITFMVPWSIGQAANVRVAAAAGAGDAVATRRAGFAAMALAAMWMASAGLALRAAPRTIVVVFLLGRSDPATAALAVRLVRIAALFQVVDGIQTTAAGALRGLKDARVPMVLAAAGYWGVGFLLGDVLAFRAGLGAVGLWWGLLAGLGSVAAALTARFAVLTRASGRQGFCPCTPWGK